MLDGHCLFVYRYVFVSCVPFLCLCPNQKNKQKQNKTLAAALEGLDSILGAWLTLYMYTICIKSKKQRLIMRLRCITCIAACSQEHFSVSQHA